MLTWQQLREVVRVSIELTEEKDRSRLFDKILRTAMEITGCDAGTLYLYKNDLLYFKVMKTLSQGVERGENGEPIDLPPLPLREENVCAFAAIHRELINIPDVYSSERFDFSGPRRYDAMTGYRTASMLVVPLENTENELIGVLQLINKTDEEGCILPFTQEDEFILSSLGSMTAVSLANMIYIDEIKAQMFSFVQAFAAAVDARTPYNGTHTRKVTIYANLLALHINHLHAQGLTEEYFDEARREQLVLAAALHDIGKMIVPLGVMNKSTRLDERLDTIRRRFALLRVLYERDMLRGHITEEAYGSFCTELDEALAFIEAKNGAGFLTDEDIERIRAIGNMTYEDGGGQAIPYLTAEELECMTIRKGTLTAGERRIMESHVEMTDRILDKVRFSAKYAQARTFAAEHHEYLNGTGYPRRLAAPALSLETRILTVADVYDALTCTDRPYKQPIPRPRSFAILHAMAGDGQLDERVVTWLEEALSDIDQKDVERLASTEDWWNIEADVFPPPDGTMRGDGV